MSEPMSDDLNYVWCPSVDVCAWCSDSECDGIACIANLDADDPADHEAIERLHDWLRRGRVAEQVDAILADAEGRSEVNRSAAPTPTPEPPTEVDAERLAELFHTTYERLAPSFSYETRKASAVPWSEVPDPNRSLMVAVAAEVLAALDAHYAEVAR